jgi:hypothetical protein
MCVVGFGDMFGANVGIIRGCCKHLAVEFGTLGANAYFCTVYGHRRDVPALTLY